MANPVGKVVVLEGQAFVRGKDGIDRILKQGDVVHEGDVIITSPGSQVGIDFTGGQPSLMIGGNETVTLDNAVSGQNLPDPADAALSANVGDTAAIAQAIVSGNSLDELLEETAAGVDGGGAESGHSFVRLLRIAEDVAPLSLDYGTGSADQTAGSLAGVEFTNGMPVAVPDQVVTDEDTSVMVDVRANDSDPENDPLTVVSVSNGAHGTVVIDPASGNPVYSPDPNWHGEDTFSYTISDGRGGTSSASVTVTVNPVNDAPVPGTISVNPDGSTAADPNSTGSGNYAHTIPEDTSVSGQVRATDVDGDTLAFSLATGPQHGSVTVEADGSYTYTPDADYNGNDAFTVLVDDGQGGTAISTVDIVITPVDDASTISVGQGSVTEDVVLSTSGRLSIADPDGPQDERFVAQTSVSGAHGTFSLGEDGSWTYNLNNSDPAVQALDPGQTLTEVFPVSGVDGTPSTVTITINGTAEYVPPPPPANSIPDAVDDLVTTDPDMPVNINVLGNDSDPDGDALAVITYGQGSNGTVSQSGSELVYTPNAGFVGTDTFTYTISDGRGGTDTATVTINVGLANDPPVAVDDSASTAEDTPITLPAADLLANDSDPDGDPLSISAVGPATHGTVVLNADGSVTFTPEANYNGQASFVYTISDGNGGTDTATVTLTIPGTNDAPIAVNDGPLSTDEDVPLTGINVLGNDSDPDGDPLTVTAVSSPNGSVVINPDGTLDFTPAANFSGPTTITYTIDDGNGGTTDATVTIDVTPVADMPLLSVESHVADTLISTSWESNANNDNSSTVNAVGSFEGWTLLTTPEIQSGGQNSFEIWSSGDSQENAATNMVTVYAAPGNGDDFLELNDAGVATDGTVMPQTLGIARTITTQDGMVYQLSFDYAGRPGFSTAYTSIAIQIDGTTVATYANTSPSTAIDWKNLKLAFEGDGAAHTISIIGTPTTTHRNGRGSFIDDIVLTEQQGVVAANANGGASTDIRLASYITAALADTDGSETLTLTLSGLPSGAQVISGSEVHSAVGGSITLSGDELADAMLRIDGSFRGDLSVDVVATATETANGDAASTPAQTLDLTILAPAGSLQAVDIADSTSSVITGTSSADTLTGTTSANTIYGLAGNDTIDGRGGNDIISGGTGNDTLTGGSGADVFKWSLGDAGTAGAPAVDRIVDGAAFNSTSGEALDLRDLLQGEVHGASDTGNLSSYLHFTYDSASNQTTIEVSSHGSGSAGPDQLIVLSGVNLVGSSTSDEAIIQDLLTRGKLITD